MFGDQSSAQVSISLLDPTVISKADNLVAGEHERVDQDALALAAASEVSAFTAW